MNYITDAVSVLACVCVCVVWHMCMFIHMCGGENQFRVYEDYTHIDGHISTHTVLKWEVREGSSWWCLACYAKPPRMRPWTLGYLPSLHLLFSPRPHHPHFLLCIYLPFSPPCLSILLLSKFCYLWIMSLTFSLQPLLACCEMIIDIVERHCAAVFKGSGIGWTSMGLNKL